MKAEDIITRMEAMRNEAQREVLMGFFKTQPGEYGEGDEFLGLKVPQTRKIVNEVKELPLEEVPTLLMNRWHEVRLCGLLILVEKFEALTKPKLINDEKAISKRDEILKMYLDLAEQANNWDLVDLSAPKILGHWLLLPTKIKESKLQILDSLAMSDNLWRQRMSYAEKLLLHPHDLMHKAVGWMLREMGKRVSMDLLRDFLRQHVHEMPRTTLRYAIEKMDEKERKYWMSNDLKE